MKNSVFSLWVSPSGERYVISAHTSVEPSEAEWSAYIAFIAELYSDDRTPNPINGLTFTDGGAPNVKQRKQLKEAFPERGDKPRAAIISDSTLVRGVVTALSWFNPGIRSFSPRRTHVGFAHLNVKPNEVALFMEHLRGVAANLPACKTLQAMFDQCATASTM